ncbi:hypothetical protein CK203_002396 [Vitis vinifera]|uniref:Retrotransposon gag protein n=1 Tax=Vitis vinifera TaxID=29760 RepID=A0A438KI78_VITVI|nr:hypothetical protein CK203_002396 [Vitis vinifera]
MAPLPGPLRGHESANTPIGNESNGVVVGDGATLHCACHIEYEIAEEAMNFMSYVAEVSRGWDEPNARDMGRVTSQPNAKGEMYILNDGIDMKANIAAMARRLEELEMKKMEEVQAISQTPLQAMPCAICLSYEHLVEECPTIPAMRKCLYQQPTQAPQQALNLEQAMVNLSKVVGDFVGAQKSINAQLSQRIDNVESSLNKRMDGMQNDLSHKIDNLQYSISRFANLNIVQEKETFLLNLIKIQGYPSSGGSKERIFNGGIAKEVKEGLREPKGAQKQEISVLRVSAQETMPPKETTKAEVDVLIQPTQEATTDASAPQDPTIT